MPLQDRVNKSNNSAKRLLGGLDRSVVLAIGLVCVVLYILCTVISYVMLNGLDKSTAATTFTPATLSTSNHILSPMLNDPIQVLQHTFPIHVTEWETIPHPGLSQVQEKSKIPNDLPQTMRVPQFFEKAFAPVYNVGSSGGGSTTPISSIRDYLGNHGQTLITPEQAASIGSVTTVKDKTTGEAVAMETIYCSIATYRDPECVNTIEDLYQRATYPERIRVAILDQHVFGDDTNEPICSRPKVPCDQDTTQALCKYRHLMDVFHIDARLAVGPVFARHLAHRHYRGEYFAMQIDSHVRFVQGWDADIVEQWKSAKNEMAVLTTYPSALNGSIDPVTHQSKHFTRPIMCVSDYEGQGTYKHLRHGVQPEYRPQIKGQPTMHPFWAAGFSFARGHFLIQVPYDQYLPMVFQGEEISIGLRGFTYGYDYYTPERGVCFHMYAVKEYEQIRKKVPLFWENSKIYAGVGMKAMKRLNTIIGMAHFPDSEWQQDEKENYGLGSIRNPEKFYKTFGIHPETETVEHHLCRFVGGPMMRMFIPALRENRMGIDYDKINYEFVDPAPDDEKKF